MPIQRRISDRDFERINLKQRRREYAKQLARQRAELERQIKPHADALAVLIHDLQMLNLEERLLACPDDETET